MKNNKLALLLALFVVLSSVTVRKGVAGIGVSPIPIPPPQALAIGVSPIPIPPPQAQATPLGIGVSPIPIPPPQ